MIISRTPLRISLVGGGTDTPSFYNQSPGAVVSFAINRFVYVMVNEKFDGRFRVSYSSTENVDTVDEIRHDLVRHTLGHYVIKNGLEVVSMADIPGSGTGLGSSSAFTVGLLNALDWHIGQTYRPPSALAELAFERERDAHPFVGKQDHYSAAYGGFNFMRFSRDGVQVIPLAMPPEMESHFLLLYTGMTRSADELLRAQSDAFEGNKLVVGKGMAFLAEEFYRQIQRGHVKIGELLHENWVMKKSIHGGVSSPEIDRLYEVGFHNGALGGKLLGAGGGGFLLFYAPPDTHPKIAEATGLRRVDFRIEKEGSRIIYG